MIEMEICFILNMMHHVMQVHVDSNAEHNIYNKHLIPIEKQQAKTQHVSVQIKSLFVEGKVSAIL